MWHTIICTATEWSDFFNLRDNKEAHPGIQIPAGMMKEAYYAANPTALMYGEWHLPLIREDDLAEGLSLEDLKKISVGRCARVSYLTHDGIRDTSKDIELYDRLLIGGHMSPLEHVATPYDPTNTIHNSLGMCQQGELDFWFGNFKNWVQYRKLIPNEADILRGRNA